MKKFYSICSMVFFIITFVLIILMRTRFTFVLGSFRHTFFWNPNHLLTVLLLSILGIFTALFAKKGPVRWIALIGSACVLLYVIGFSLFMIIALNHSPNPK